MEQPINMQPLQTSETITASVEIFDPPLCCPTGLCGPTLDQTLLDVNEMILSLKLRGIQVKRYQMASDPNAFLGNDNIMRLIRERQLGALPITLVKGEIIKVSEYPTLAEVENQLNGSMA